MGMDDIEILWRASRVLSYQEFEEKGLLALWSKVPDRDRSRIMAKMGAAAKKAEGVPAGKVLTDEQLKAELGGLIGGR